MILYNYEDDNLLVRQFETFTYYFYKVRPLTDANAQTTIDVKPKLFPYEHVALNCRLIRWATMKALIISSSNDAKQHLLASALVVGSKITSSPGNIYYQMLSPPFPSRLFTDNTEALNWLKQTSEIKVPPELSDAMVSQLQDTDTN